MRIKPYKGKHRRRTNINRKLRYKYRSRQISLHTPLHPSTFIFEQMSDLKFKGRNLWMMRSFTNVDYSEKVILSKSIFNFVDSWLLKKATSSNHKFLDYWHQAKDYYSAGINAKSEVKPLLNYYCCLNMVKCLLNLNRVEVENIHHGVGWQQSSNTNLDQQKIDFLGKGAHRELRKLMGKDDGEGTYSLQTLLYNLVCVHRAYCYTFTGSPELFIPLKWLKFQKKENSPNITISFKTTKPEKLTDLYQIPSLFQITTNNKNDWDQIKNLTRPEKYQWAADCNKLIFRYKRDEEWREGGRDEYKKNILTDFHRKTRRFFQYISAETPAWYIKKEDKNNLRIINYNSLVISFAAMHCLSEMVRYKPDLFAELMKSEYGWLLTEFIEVGMDQFVDEIASEITGLNIMMSGVRAKR